MSFMVKAQGNTGPEMDLLSCIHSERSASGLFFTQGMKIPFQRELGDVYNHYSACSRPPLKLSGKKRKMVKIWYEISMRYFQSKCVLFMGRETNIFYHKKKKNQFWHLFTGLGYFFYYFIFPLFPHQLVLFLLALSFST